MLVLQKTHFPLTRKEVFRNWQLIFLFDSLSNCLILFFPKIILGKMTLTRWTSTAQLPAIKNRFE